MAGSLNTTQFFSLPAESSSDTANDTEKLSLQMFAKLLPSYIFFTVLICLGIPGNLLVFLVYLKKFKASSTRVFVLAMAACDIFVCLTAVPVHVIYFRFMYTVSDSFCRVMFLLLKFPVYVSCWILVCGSLDRRHRVCQPLKRQLSARQATYVLVVPLGLTILATVPFVAFRGEVKFTTTAGVVLKECDFHSESEFWKVIIKRLEGSVLAVCCIAGLTLLVWAYSHILYRIKSQNKRKRPNFAHDTTPADNGSCASSAPETNVVSAGKQEKSQDTCDNTAEERYGSRDSENCHELAKVNAIDQHAQSLEPQTRDATEGGRQPTGRLQGWRNSLASKTTLVMFVLTTTNVVCLLPYVMWTQFHEAHYDPHLSSWTVNLVTTSKYLPSVRSTISPLIYVYFNPRFRQQCRRFLTGVGNIRL